MKEMVPWLLVLAAAAITYAWRAAGVVVAGRFAPDGAVVRWVSCVAYAMLAGLFARMIVLPAGELAQVPLAARVAALVLAIVVWRAARRNVFNGSCAGVAAVILLTVLG
jgi:branched-subunit amino acid transport protein